jgi:hypothetical protein
MKNKAMFLTLAYLVGVFCFSTSALYAGSKKTPGEKLDSAIDAAKDKAYHAKEYVKDKAYHAKDQAYHAKEAAQQKAHEAKHRAHDAKECTREKCNEARRDLADKIRPS